MKIQTTAAAWMVMMGLMNSFGGSVDGKHDTGLMKGAGGSGNWYVVNDGVMGGVSQSRAVVSDRNTLIFSGTVSLDNNGGFASIRHDADAFDVGRGDGIGVRVKGDGNRYQLRVRTSDGVDGVAYKADFDTVRDQWQDIRISWSQFEATFRGRIIADAPQLEGSRIRQIGFLIADKQEGPFQLEVESIRSL